MRLLKSIPERRDRPRRLRHAFNDRFRHTHLRDLQALLLGFNDSRQDVRPVELFQERCLSSSSFFSAAPESMASAARRIPSFQVFAAPPATRAGALFRSTTSRRGPFSPLKMPSMIFAFSAASLPCNVSIFAGALPQSSRRLIDRRSSPSRSSTTYVRLEIDTSSMPFAP